MTPERSAGSTSKVAVALLVLGMAMLVPGVVAAAGLAPSAASTQPAPAATSVVVSITATGDLSFAPDSFTVTPGESVHLIVTQAADFEHTFTLSSVANFTIPSSDSPGEVAAFFNAHPPLVNLSLGTSAGSLHPFNFTAPSTPGTYEFVCLVHFPQMTGVMTDSASSSTSSGGGGISTTEILAIGAVVAAAVIAGVVIALQRRRRAR